MSQPRLASLHQLLDTIGVSYRWYDMGRRIQRLDAAVLRRVEEQGERHPTPYLGKAWLGLTFWHPDAPQQPSIWFLCLPLDEQGQLVLGARDEFLQHLLVALGNNLEAQQQQENLHAVLEGNPYTFTPTPEKQASFQAKLTTKLKQPTSQYYSQALAYLRSEAIDGWEHVGVQGLADICARWQEPTHHRALLGAIQKLPTSAFNALCACLEHENIDHKLAQGLQQRLQQALKESHTSVAANALRALNASQATGIIEQTLNEIVANQQALPNIEILATLASRYPQHIVRPPYVAPFLEACAQQGPTAFQQLLADLLYQPDLRADLLQAFRQPERSDTLAAAIGQLWQQA